MGNSSTKSQNGSRDRSKKNVHWRAAEPSSPGKPIQVEVFDASKDTLAIEWERPLVDGGSPIIGYWLEQRRVGSPIWARTSATIIPHAEIMLTGVEPTWRYQFRVFAQNAIGVSESSAISDPISATRQRNGPSPPQFVNELQNTAVLENDQCEFSVTVLGTPAPLIKWFKDGFEIFSSRRAKVINEHGSSTLIFHQVALTDEGEIKCTATNRLGQVATKCFLEIEAPPKIRLPRQYEDGLLVEAGEVLKLKVGTAGRPMPAIAWTHNGDVIRNGGRFEINTNDKNSFLKIAKVTRKDRGEYGVRAINKLGEFNATFLVTVTAKPNPPENVRITMSLGKSVTLSWTAPEDDGGCKIGNYIVEYFRVGWDVWLKASSTRQLTATLNDLIEGSEYRFRVKAESPYGLSEPSVESKVLFIPDHKRGIVSPAREQRHNRTDIENVRVISGNGNSISQIKIRDIPKNVQLISQVYDNESIVNELNYGTSVDSASKKRDLYRKSSVERKKVLKDATNNETTEIRLEVANDEIDGNEPAHNGVHSSNEFTLALYNDKEKENRNQFDLDLHEAISAPPISLSTPDLHDMSSYNAFKPLRRSASSSEMLYEKAMQRFYQAVELDEAEIARKRGDSVEPRSSLNKIDYTRIQDIETQSNTNTFEPNTENEAIEVIESTSHDLHQEENPFEESNVIDDDDDDWEEDYDRDLRKEIIESQRRRSSKTSEKLPREFYADDYSESTASIGSMSSMASVESIEQFMNSVRSASASTLNITRQQSNTEDELETYHPPMDVARALSPYRTPEPGQATVILNKPAPRPDPEYVPKPILRRRRQEKIERANEAQPQTVANVEKIGEVKAVPMEIVEAMEKTDEQIDQWNEIEAREIEKIEAQPQIIEKWNEIKPMEVERNEKTEKISYTQPQVFEKEQKNVIKPMKIEKKNEIKAEKVDSKPAKAENKIEIKPEKIEKVMNEPTKLLTKPITPKREKRGFLQFFSRKSNSSPPKNEPKPTNESPAPTTQNKVEEVPTAVQQIAKPANDRAEEKERVLRQRQNSIDEMRCAVDHYSDLIREVSGKPLSRKPKIPLYMSSEAIHQLAAKAEMEARSTQYLDQSPDEIDQLAKKMTQYVESMDSESSANEPPRKKTR